MKYGIIFEITITHNYFSDQKVRGIELVPTFSCARKLAGYGLMLRRKANRWQVLGSVKENNEVDNEWISSRDIEGTFKFFIKVMDTGLLNITKEWNQTTVSNALNGIKYPMYSNSLSRFSFYEERHQQLGKTHQLEKESVFLEKPPISTIGIDQFQVTGIQNPPQVLSYSSSNKEIVLDTSAHKKGEEFILTYPIMPNWPKDAFALVEYSRTDSTSIGEKFEISFQSKLEKWNYYLITNSSGIKVTETSDQLAFEQESSPTSDPVFKQLKKKYPNTYIKKYTSISEISYQENNTFYIRLKDGEAILPKNLAIPNIKNTNNQIIHYFTS